MPPTTRDQLDPKVLKVLDAIRRVESGGDYSAIGDNGTSAGAFQWNNGKRPLAQGEIPANFKRDAQEVGLDGNDFSKGGQNKVAYLKLKKLKDEGRGPEEIAALWNGAKKDAGGKYTYVNPEYGEKFRMALGASGSTQNIPSQPGAPMANAAATGYAPPIPPKPYIPTEAPEGGAEKKGLAQNVAEFLFPILEKKERTPLQTVGDVGMSALTLVPGAGLLGLGTKGLKAASLGTKVAQLGGLGYAADVASKLGGGETDAAKIATPGLGTAVGVGGGALSGLASKFGTGVLSRTSGVPQKAFEVAAERPGLVNATIKTATPETTRDVATKAVRTLRTNLTSDWKKGVDELVTKYEGARVGLPENVAKELADIADRYNTSTKLRVRIPNNPQNLSVKELTDLITDINGLPYKAVDPDRAVADMGKYLKELGKKSFNENDDFVNFYASYAKKKQILDEAESIVRAFGAKNPISRTTATNRLQKIFDDDKEEYLKAIQALERETGVDILSKVAAGKFQSRMPRDLSKGLDLNDLVQILAIPLTSPRASLWLSKFLNPGGGPVSQGLKGLLHLAPIGGAQLDDLYTQ